MTKYAAADFKSPKVCGLAVHQVKLRTEREEQVAEERRAAGKSAAYPIPAPLLPWCLFGILPDCSAVELSGSATATEMQGVLKAGNLKILAKKYGLIGFVYSRTPKRRREYEVLPVPGAGKGPCGAGCRCAEGGAR